MALWGRGGGGGGDSPHSHGTLWRSFFCQTRRESNQGRLKVRFLDVLNPGLEGFDTVLGGLFGLGGGGVTPLIPMEL